MHISPNVVITICPKVSSGCFCRSNNLCLHLIFSSVSLVKQVSLGSGVGLYYISLIEQAPRTRGSSFLALSNMVILIVGIQIQQHRLSVSHTLPLCSVLIVPHLLQPGVPVSGMHINCGNEGHPEEQLEVLLCFYNRLGWEVAAWWEPQCASEKHHMVLAHHLLSFSAGHSDKVNHWPYIMEGQRVVLEIHLCPPNPILRYTCLLLCVHLLALITNLGL